MQPSGNNSQVEALVYRESQNGYRTMPNLISLSAVDSWAIYTEIGERLRNVLPVDHSKLPAHIEDRLNRLRELDGEPSPSIVPPMNTRWFE
jgi:hypothetical protein